ncbi:RCC1 domain-containing protein [Catellatospora sp. KI3]|uniref:RCC1 domain-containing protein n=1 Tax=Catellatospora sp. KI3 TaxID=3041620 RepID=UPI0024824715|nr:RCC1 domain-containing protein [Catellatospora sp. KI3]MDI1461159.1 RCC1 domain-containing protein [Catellatospora sp. KI3]
MMGRVVAGYYHTCTIAQSGHLYCWGGNNDGRLGLSGASRAAPTLVALTPRRTGHHAPG